VLHGRKPVGVLHDQRGAGQRPGDVPAGVAEAVADVRARLGAQRGEIREVPGQRLAPVHERGAGGERLFQRDHGRHRLVVHLDELERLSGGRFVRGDGGRHRLALEADDVDGQDGSVAERRAAIGITPGQLCAGQHDDDARQRAGAGGIDAGEARVRVRRAQNLGVRHAGQHQVGHIPRAARDLLDAVDPRHRPADVPHRPPAVRMASTIFR
jgi:hypothetical protein